jgi:hypothetical protein
MIKSISLMMMALASLSLGGCALYHGGAPISDKAWLLDSGNRSANADPVSSTDYLPDACPQTEQAAKTFTAVDDIDKCVYAMLQLIDVKWSHFEDQLLGSSSNANLAADVGLLGLNAAGTLISGGATQILHAASAGVTGLRTAVNQDLLYSSTITTILLQMQADRTAVRKQITGRLDNAGHAYTNMYDAANDLFSYARAGSWTHALLSIQQSAATSNGNPPGGSTAAVSKLAQ